MKRIVWTFGLIAGGIMGGMLALAMMFKDAVGDNGLIVGYTTMVLAFVLAYFGIRSYRDSVLGGVIGFGEAFKVGILITLVASACYVASWEVIARTVATDYAPKYAASVIEKQRAKGASPAQLEATQKAMAKFVEDYKNPLIRTGYTFLEVFPVGLVVVLVSAGVLRRRKN